MKKSYFDLTNLSLLFASLAFWILSILTAQYSFSSSVFSYFFLLPMSYWVSISLLIVTISFRLLKVKNPNQGLFDCLTLFVLVLVLFGTPSFIEQTPRMLDVYGHISQALAVQSTGKAGPSLLAQNVPASSYEVNYPGFFILVTSILSLTGLSWISVAQYYPIFLMVLISFLIYVIARKFSQRFSILAPAVFLSFAWFEEFHLSPDSFALVLYLIAWLIFIQILDRKKGMPPRASLVSFLLIIFSLIVSHAGGPIFVLLNLAAFLIIGYFSYFRIQFSRKNWLILFLFIFVLYLAWSLDGAFTSFSTLLQSVIDSLGKLSINAIASRTAPLSSGYYLVGLMREAEIGIINLAGLICGIFIIRSNKTRNYGIVLLSWWVSCWSFALYSFGSSGSYIERPALFSLIPVGLMVATFLSTLKTSSRFKLFAIFTVLLIGIGSFILPITRNANDVFETPPLSSISAANFAVSEISPALIIGGHNYEKTVLYAGPNLSLEALFDQIDSKSIPYGYLFDNTILIQNMSLLLFDRPAYAYAVNYGYAAEYQQVQNFSLSQFSRIYDNGGATIYINRLENFNLTSEFGNKFADIGS
jgi:hypothetical protein